MSSYHMPYDYATFFLVQPIWISYPTFNDKTCHLALLQKYKLNLTRSLQSLSCQALDPWDHTRTCMKKWDFEAWWKLSLPLLLSGLALHCIGTQTYMNFQFLPFASSFISLGWCPLHLVAPLLQAWMTYHLVACGIWFPEDTMGCLMVKYRSSGELPPYGWTLTNEKWVTEGAKINYLVWFYFCLLWTIHPCKPPWRRPSCQVNMSAEQLAISLHGF